MDKLTGVIYDGYPSMEEIKEANGWPSEERFAQGPVAIAECVQPIPCNPCEDACPFHAIEIGQPITNTPQIDRGKCTGCGMCVAACSGLAIFVVDKTYSDTEATVSFPYEYIPLPAIGMDVDALNRGGEFICKGIVTKVMNPKRNDHTPVITIAVKKELVDNVRTIRRLGSTDVTDAFQRIVPEGHLDDDIIVCRCEEITAGEIRKAIREYKAFSVTEIKRRVRAGMGLCQGRTCGKLVMRILAEETGQKMNELQPSTDRPPVRPVTFGELIGSDDMKEGGAKNE